MKLVVDCDWCDELIIRPPSLIKKHNFCSRSCMNYYASKKHNPAGYKDLKDFTKISKHMSALNKRLNPTRMRQETKLKLRVKSLARGNNGKTYEKTHGRPTHRVIAEAKLGRKLKPGEVVHHKDGNSRNNAPENLKVFSSQAEHARSHKGGEPNEV